MEVRILFRKATWLETTCDGLKLVPRVLQVEVDMWYFYRWNKLLSAINKICEPFKGGLMPLVNGISYGFHH